MNSILNQIRNRKITLLFTLLLLFSVQFVSARPFIGSESDIVTEQCGECVCSYKTEATYVFWVKVGSSKTLTTVDCN